MAWQLKQSGGVCECLRYWVAWLPSNGAKLGKLMDQLNKDGDRSVDFRKTKSRHNYN